MMSCLRWGTTACAGLVIALAGCSQPTPEESMARGQAALEKQDYAHALVELKTAAAARKRLAVSRGKASLRARRGSMRSSPCVSAALSGAACASRARLMAAANCALFSSTRMRRRRAPEYPLAS